MLTWQGITTCKRIARETATTLTKRTVIMNAAFGIDAACARTRILTALTNACFFGGALSAQHTLGSTVRWQTDVELKTGANRLAI